MAFRVAPSTAEYIVGSFGYYLMAGLVTVWAISFGRSLRAQPIQCPSRVRFLKIAAVVGAATYLCLALEPMQFKIVMDEPLLASTAQMMHEDRLALVPNRGVDSTGFYELYEGTTDKRPLLYPFLVSLLHDLTGYRVANSFVVNALLTPVFWTLVWALGASLRRRDSDGFLAVALLATAPLLANLATSGGFDWLHGTLLLTLLWVTRRWERTPDSTAAQATVVATLGLIANTRYEGLLWAVPFGLYLLLRSGGWRRPVRLSWIVYAAPLLVFMPFIHRRIDEFPNRMTWQAGPDGRVEKFSFDYLADNLRAAGRFFLEMDHTSLASSLVFLIGMAGLIGALFKFGQCLQRGVRKKDWSTFLRYGAWFVFGVGSIAHFTLLMFFNWGYLLEYAVVRLSLPVHLSLALIGVLGVTKSPRPTFSAALFLGAGFIAYHIFGTDVVQFLESGLHLLLFAIIAMLAMLAWTLKFPQRFPEGVSLLAVVFIVVWSGPQITRHLFMGPVYPDQKRVTSVHDFIDQHKEERFLFIMGGPYVAILKRVPAVWPYHVTRNIEGFRERVEVQRAFDAVYYTEIYAFDEDAKTWKSLYPPLAHPDLDLELLETRALGRDRESRFYRVHLRAASPDKSDDAS